VGLVNREDFADANLACVVVNRIKRSVRPADVEPVHFPAINRESFPIAAAGSRTRIRVVGQLFEVVADDTVGFLIGISQKFPRLLAKQDGESHA